jgi:drug/metabolite transporter (DMT)-like permease
LGTGARTLTGDRRLAGGFAGTGVVLVALGAAVWGTDTVLRAPLSAAFAPVLLVLGEHLVLALYAVPAVALGWREFRRLDLPRWGALIVVGWGGSAVATILFTTGLFAAFEAGEGSVNTVLLLQQTQPLFAITAAAVVLGERLTVVYAPIFVVAALGAYLLAFGDLMGEPGGLLAPFTQVGRTRLEFALAALGAAALWGTSTAMGRYLGSRLSFPTLTGARFLVALPLLLVWAAISVPDAAGGFVGGLAEPQVARNLVLLALFPGLLGLLLYYGGLRSTPASYATLAELAYPATGVALNWLLLGQPLTVAQGIGVVLVVGAIAAMNRVKSGVRERSLRVRRLSQGG